MSDLSPWLKLGLSKIPPFFSLVLLPLKETLVEMLEGRKQKQQQHIEKKWSCPGNKSKQGHGGMDANLSYVSCNTGSMTTFPRTVFINLRFHWNSGSACHNTAPLPQKLCLAFDHLLLISIHPTPNSGRWKNSSFICIFFLDVDLTATCTQRCQQTASSLLCFLTNSHLCSGGPRHH